MGAKFRILTVCTGNVCRSPLAEQLLRAQLAAWGTFEVSSAGTRALEGQQMPEETQAVARSLGVPHPEDHRARQLTEGMLDDADLVLAMAREHRRAIVELNPRVARRTFTIRELARYAAVVTDEDVLEELSFSPSGPGAQLRAAVRALSVGRASARPPQDPVDDDVRDPYRQPLAVHQQMGQQLAPAVNAAVNYLVHAGEVS